MHGRRRIAAAGALLALAGALAAVLALVVVPGPAPAPPRPPVARAAARGAAVTILQDDAVMLHRPRGEMRRAIGDLRSLGVDWLRITAGWSAIAPRPRSRRAPRRFDARDPAAYPRGTWRALDRAVRMAHAGGLNLDIDIAFWAPRWAVARAPDIRTRPPRARWAPDPRAYAAFAHAVATRYSGRYVPRGGGGPLPAAVAFTLWNEPNFGLFLQPQRHGRRAGFAPQSPDVYRALVEAAYPAVKDAAPRALVLIGGTSATRTPHAASRRAGVAPLAFLRGLACVDRRLRPRHDGACAHFRPVPGDGWAHHPYSLTLRPSQHDPVADDVRIADLGRLVRLLRRLHAMGRLRSRMDVWVTEYGVQTDPPDPTAPWTPAQQAAILAEADRIAAATPGVRSFAQFLLVDLPKRDGATRRDRWGDYQSGLLTEGLRPKPAFAAFRLPLVARRLRSGAVRVWGRVRPGSGERIARVGVRSGPAAPWRLLRAVRSGPEGYFAFTAHVRPRAELRLRARAGGRWFSGVPVPVAGR